MNLDDLPCPWPDGNADLCLVELNNVQKTWLAHQMVEKIQTARSLSNSYNLKASTLRTYARHLREKRCMMKSVGRPSTVDSIGVMMLRSKWLSNTTVHKSDFNTHIEDEHRTTVVRRYAYNVQDPATKSLSRRSLKRYADRVK